MGSHEDVLRVAFQEDSGQVTSEREERKITKIHHSHLSETHESLDQGIAEELDKMGISMRYLQGEMIGLA